VSYLFVLEKYGVDWKRYEQHVEGACTDRAELEDERVPLGKRAAKHQPSSAAQNRIGERDALGEHAFVGVCLVNQRHDSGLVVWVKVLVALQQQLICQERDASGVQQAVSYSQPV